MYRQKLTIKLAKILLGLLALSSPFLITNTLKAEPSQSDSVTNYCTSNAPKVSAEACQKAATQSRNKASYNCDSADKLDSCIRDKATQYISKAIAEAGGKNATTAKFNTSIDKVLDDVPGDRNKPSAEASKSLPAEKSQASDNSFSLNASKQGTNSGRCGNEASGTSVETKFNFGCLGNKGPKTMGPIEDLAYAIIRFLSYGVGIVLVISIIIAGIQYSSSEGNAEATQAAKSRIQNAIIGLVVYLMAFSAVQYLVPGGVFNGSMLYSVTSQELFR
jgi:hypothetical protein